MTWGMSTAMRTARAQAIITEIGTNALLRFYDGSRPSTGGTVTTLLGTVTFSGNIGTASGGVITFSDPASSNAVASGTATWARIVKSDGTTFAADLSVGTSGQDINLTTTSITSGLGIDITGGTLTEGNA